MKLFNFWKNKPKKTSLQTEAVLEDSYLQTVINLQKKTTALNGIIENYWFENIHAGIEKTLLHKITIPLKPFDSEIDYEENPVKTSLEIDYLKLDLINQNEFDNLTIKSDKESDIETSIYLGYKYNPFDIINLTFKKITKNQYQVKGKILINFEHEMVAKNEDFTFETFVDVNLIH